MRIPSIKHLIVWHYYIWMYLRLQEKSVMQILNIFDYIGFYNRIISGLVIQCSENDWTKFLLKAWKFCHCILGGTSWAALHFLSTIFLGQLCLFAAVIYSTFSLHMVVYMSTVEIKCQLHSFFNLFSVMPSEKQILKLNELFLSLCLYN